MEYKRQKGHVPVETVVSENLRKLMDYHRQATPTAAARYAGVSQQQFDRMLKGQRVRIDTLERVARRYGLQPYQLLVPDLNPARPQLTSILNAMEQAVLDALRAPRDPNPGTQ